MAKTIKGKDIIEDNHLSNAIKDSEDYLKVVKDINTQLKETAKLSKSGLPGININSAKGIKQVNDEFKKSTVLKKEVIKQDKEMLALEKQLMAARDEHVKGKLRLQRANKQQRDSLKAEIVLNDKLSGTEERLLATNAKLRQERKKLIETDKDYQKNLLRINSALDKNNAKIESNSDRLKQQKIGIGRYSEALKGAVGGLKRFAAGLGLAFGLRAIKDSIVSLNLLANEARGVQFAFEKLGSLGVKSLEATRKSTRGLLSDLNLKRALVEFDNFNISLSQSDVLFEFLAVRAAQTGTSIDKLKQSLVEGLSKESKLRIDNLGISAAQLNAELEQTPNFVDAVANIAKREIAEAGSILDDAASSQQKWNVQLQNAKVRISAITQSGFANALRNFATSTLELLFPTEKLSEAYADQQVELNVLVNSITDTNIAEDDRLVLINKLIAQYPKYLSEIDAETVSNEELIGTLDELNQLFVKRIALQTQEELISEALTEAGERALDQAKTQIEVNRQLAKVNSGIFKDSLDLTNKSFEERIKIVQGALAVDAEYIESIRDGSTVAANEEAKALERLNRSLGTNNFAKRDLKNANDELTETEKELKLVEEALGTTLEDINSLFDDGTEAKKRSTAATDEEIKAAEKLRDLLDRDFNQNERENIKIREKNRDDEAKSIKKTAEQLNKDLADNDKENSRTKVQNARDVAKEIDRINKEQEKSAAQDVKNRKKAADDLLKSIKDSAKLTSDAITTVFDNAQSKLDQATQNSNDRISDLQSSINNLQERANLGDLDAKESIKLEKQKIAQERVQIDALEQKRRNLLIVTTGLQLALSKIQSGDGNGLANASSQLSSFLAGLEGFYEGTDTTVGAALGNALAITGDRDTHVAKFHKDERIISVENSRKLGSMTQDEITTRALLSKNGEFAGKRAVVGVNRVAAFNDTKMVNAVNKNTQVLEQAIKNIPEHHLDYDPITKIATDIIKTGNSIERNHKNIGGIFS